MIRILSQLSGRITLSNLVHRRKESSSSARTKKLFYSSMLRIIKCWAWVKIILYTSDLKYPHLNTEEERHPARHEPCALLFFGLLKHFEDIALPAIRKNILQNNPQCDIFLHTYELKELPINARNTELEIEKMNATEAYLLTDHVAIESMESFATKRTPFMEHSRRLYHRGWGECCQSHDNMIKQWHSIAGVWDLMRRNEIAMVGNNDTTYYTHVGLFRSDVYQATPIGNIFDSTAVVPVFDNYGGINDRIFYGTYKNARRWADRFGFSETFENKYMIAYEPNNPKSIHTTHGYHSEHYLKQLLKHFQINENPKWDLCCWRIRSVGRLQISDCMELNEALKFMPSGFMLEGSSKKVARHWSGVWDAPVRPLDWAETTDIFDIGSNR